MNVYIPIKCADWPIARRTIEYVQKNIECNKIIIISSPELKRIVDIDRYGVGFISENEIVTDMTYDRVAMLLDYYGERPEAAGWYLQQFIKLGVSRIIDDKYYLTWDADTIPLRKIEIFRKSDGLPYFSLKREYHKRYFDVLWETLNIRKMISPSFISEHMVFKTEYVRQMLNEIEENDCIPGKLFFEKLCIASSAVALRGENNNFSEFEMYGNWVTKKYPDSYCFRKLKTLRCGTLYLGNKPSYTHLKWASRSFDTVSFEVSEWPSGKVNYVFLMINILRFFPLDFAIKVVSKLFNFLSILPIRKIRDIAKWIDMRKEFDYIFSNHSMWDIRNRDDRS